MAWVRYGAVPLIVEAETVAWTDLAVAICWQSPEGEHQAWVWRRRYGHVDEGKVKYGSMSVCTFHTRPAAPT